MYFSFTSILLMIPVIHSRGKSYRRSVEQLEYPEATVESKTSKQTEFRPFSGGGRKRQKFQNSDDGVPVELSFGRKPYGDKNSRNRRMNAHNVNIQVQATYGSKWDVSNVSRELLYNWLTIFVHLELWSSAWWVTLPSAARSFWNTTRARNMRCYSGRAILTWIQLYCALSGSKIICSYMFIVNNRFL